MIFQEEISLILLETWRSNLKFQNRQTFNEVLKCHNDNLGMLESMLA